MRLKFFAEDGGLIRVAEDLYLDYEVERLINDSREDLNVWDWELVDEVGIRCSWERNQDRIVIVDRSDRWSGGDWDPPPNQFKEPWSWSYKHPELPEWRCHADNQAEATRIFQELWMTAHRKGRLWNINGRFHDGVVFKREKGARKMKRRGLPGDETERGDS